MHEVDSLFVGSTHEKKGGMKSMKKVSKKEALLAKLMAKKAEAAVVRGHCLPDHCHGSF